MGHLHTRFKSGVCNSQLLHCLDNRGMWYRILEKWYKVVQAKVVIKAQCMEGNEKRSWEREKTADFRLGGIVGRRNASGCSFVSVMSGLCAQSFVSSSSAAGHPNEGAAAPLPKSLSQGFRSSSASGHSSVLWVTGHIYSSQMWLLCYQLVVQKPNLGMGQSCRLKLAVIRSLQDFEVPSWSQQMVPAIISFKEPNKGLSVCLCVPLAYTHCDTKAPSVHKAFLPF